MHPSVHLKASVLVVAMLAIYYQLEIATLASWLLTACLAALALDLDHLLYPLFKRETRPLIKKIIKNPLYIPQNPMAFVDEIHFRGLGIIRLGTHLVWGTALYLLAKSAFPSLIIPVLASITAHIALDTVEVMLRPERR